MIYQSAALTPLGEFLKAPKGFCLEQLVAVTYSLSGSALLSLAISGYLASQGDDLEDLQLREVAAQEELVRAWAGEHFRAFSHYFPESENNKVVWEQACVLSDLCCVRVEGKGTFHPKLLLACFRRGEEWRYRLQVGSQNLGSHGGVELSLCLEGAHGEGNVNGADLLGFFRPFYPEADGCSHLKGLEKAEFRQRSHPDDKYRLENVRFFYRDDQNNTRLIDRLKERLCSGDDWDGSLQVYSPFLTPDQTGALYLDTQLSCPIVYHTNLSKSLWAQKGVLPRVWCVKDMGKFLHAKLYYRRKGGDLDYCTYRVMLGSANTSANGLERNVELMVSFDWCVQRYHDGRTLGEDGSWDEENPARQTHYLKQLDGSTETDYEFIALSSCKNAPPDDDDKARAEQNLKHYINGFQATAMGQPDRKWKIRLTTPKTLPAGIGLNAIEVEGKPWQNGGVVLEAEEMPCGKLLRVAVKGQYNGQEIVVSCSVPLDIDGTGTQGDSPLRKPTPMLQLLTDFKARDAIPRCRKKGFANPNDDVMERLEAYFASWKGSEYEDAAWRRICLSVLNVVDSLTENEDCWENINITGKELDKLEQLCGILNYKGEEGK